MILNEIFQELSKFSDTDVKLIHVADMSLKYCIGCGACYKTGKCIYNDDIERLSSEIEDADGIILGSPTYASNVSAQMKTIIDRGHFVMEQLLYGKYALSVTTYENYVGKDSAKILNGLLSYSGAQLCGSVIYHSKRNSSPLENNKNIQKITETLYYSIKKKRNYIFQRIVHFFVFEIGIKPFIIKNSNQYAGVINYWKNKHII